MLSKYIIPALCASLTLQGVAAAHQHRHLHNLKKKDLYTDVVVVTEVLTRTVYEGEELPTEATAATAVASVFAAKRPSRRPHSHKVTTTSSTPVVVATPEAVQESSTTVVEPTSSVVILDVPSSTTMVTSVATPAADIVAAAATQIAAVTQAVASVVSSVASQATAASYSTGVKRGAAYNDVALVNKVIGAASGVFGWAYNWGASDGGLTANVPFIPTCWSPGKSSGWSANAAKAIAKGADALFSFNECDIASQANLSPASAAASHIELMNPFKGQVKIGAPAISSSQNANQGIDWLTQFLSACGGNCAVDFCNVHWYGPGGVAGAEEFLTHLVNAHTACGGKPIWVTEFKAEDSTDNEATFMKHALTELDTNSKYNFVERYAYFFVNDGFLATGGALNAMGQIYASL